MRTFNFHSAKSLEEALSILAELGEACRVVAGGTDLLVQLRKEEAGRQSKLRLVLDINGLSELAGIRLEENEIHIGALTTHAQIAAHQQVQKEVSFLAEACRMVGSPQIRNRGTIGGNVVNASPAADSLPPLAALDAMAELLSVRGRRVIPLVELLTRPYSPLFEPDELLTGISFSRPPLGSKSCFIKVGRRKALAISRLSVAVMVSGLKSNNLSCSDEKPLTSVQQEAKSELEVRIVPGAAFPMPARAKEAEAIFQSPEASNKSWDEIFTLAGQAVADEMIQRAGVRWSTEYKYSALTGITKRALKHLIGGELI